jgi:Fe-S-cluster containining protein
MARAVARYISTISDPINVCRQCQGAGRRAASRHKSIGPGPVICYKWLMQRIPLPKMRDSLNRDTPFGFSCNRCLQCCRDKKIQVNPYEIARLAARLGISTTVFIAEHTDAGGVHLRFDDEGACVFLDAQGCSVHEDRPLVCRLYPLGRHLDGSDIETFSEVEPEPGARALHRRRAP